MALEIRIAGPGLDVTRRLEAGQLPLILGRDAECTVCLPDPDRNVSRRHLSVWCEADELQFHVVSVVNGVDLASGEAPPGARGVLPQGQVLKIGDYELTYELASGEAPAAGVAAAGAAAAEAPAAAAVPAPADEDPWAALERDSSYDRDAPQSADSMMPEDADDPFGDWGFETTFGSDEPAAGALQASALPPAEDVSAFFQGLGLDLAKIGTLSKGDLESVGKLVRLAVMGVLELHESVAGTKQQLRSDDRTMMATKAERNPLKEADIPEEVALTYLFSGRPPAAGFVGPERALRELITDLVVHEKASVAAARAAVEGTLKDFEPEALKARLLPGGSKLFESARAWDAYAKDYEERKETLGQWAQRLLDKYFAGAYLRESQRLKRDTGPRQR